MSLLSGKQIVIFVVAVMAWSAALADNDGSAPSGQSIYEESCKSCHGGGIGGFFSGAPKTGDKEEWAPLIEKGLATLIESTLNGFGDMEPRGKCETCSDSDITASVKYMVEKSR